MVKLILAAGEDQLEHHKIAIEAISGVNLQCVNTLHDALDINQVDGLVVLDIPHKNHHINQAIEAGIHVLTTHPLDLKSKAIQGLLNKDNNVQVCLLSRGRSTWYNQSGIAFETLLGQVLKYHLDLDLNSSASTMERKVHFGGFAIELCDLILAHWGPVDALYCRMRNFCHGGPYEDSIDVMLRMRNGVEGFAMLSDHPSSKTNLRAQFYTTGDAIALELEMHFDGADLNNYYENFVESIAGRAEALVDLRQVVESYRLYDCMRKSSQIDSVLYSKDMR